MTSSNNNSKQQTVIFLHIPKAAGSTLHQIIEQQYEPSTIFTINEQRTIDDFTNLSEAQRAALRVLKGHMYFGFHEFFPQPSTYITMLRDPIDRVISHYYYVLREPRNELHKIVTSRNMSLKDFVTSGIYLHIDNGQTRLLSTTGATFDYGQCSKEMLKSAKENIEEHFTVVGLAERFDESLIFLKRNFNWRRQPFYVKQNVTKNRPLKQNISKDTLDTLEKYNELDIELYQYAETLFDKRINQEKLFEIELKTLQSLNRVYRYCVGTVSNNTLTDSANSSPIQTTDLPDISAIPGINNLREINFIAAFTNRPSGFFDEVNGSSAKTIEVTNATPITAKGWAILADEGRIADMVIITCKDKNSLIAVAPVDWERPDVVDHLKNHAYSNCGWMTTFNSSTLPADKVVLLAWAYNSARKEATQLNSTHEVILKSQGKSLQAELGQLQAELQQTQGKWDSSQAQKKQTQTEKEFAQSQLQHIPTELERSQAAITEMESSKFWKLRTALFRLLGNWLKR